MLSSNSIMTLYKYGCVPQHYKRTRLLLITLIYYYYIMHHMFLSLSIYGHSTYASGDHPPMRTVELLVYKSCIHHYLDCAYLISYSSVCCAVFLWDL